MGEGDNVMPIDLVDSSSKDGVEEEEDDVDEVNPRLTRGTPYLGKWKKTMLLMLKKLMSHNGV